MKKILLIYLLISSNFTFAQKHLVEISINPLTSFFNVLEFGTSGYSLSVTYQIAKDFDVECNLTQSSFSYSGNILFNTRNDPLWTKFGIHGNYYLRPTIGSDRWFISSLIAVEGQNADYNFSRFQRQADGTSILVKKIIKGNVQRYSLGIGFGYKRVLFKRVPIQLSFHTTRTFASHNSDSLKQELPNIDKITNYSPGAKFHFTIGYRFYLQKEQKTISE